MLEAIEDTTTPVTENYADFDFNDEATLQGYFPQFEEYPSFLLDDIGIVKWFKAEKKEVAGRKITTGYGFIVSQNGDVYFRLPACQKPEFDPETKEKKYVRQYRRVKPGQAVTFEVKESERGLRTERFVFWEPSEFEKIEQQVLLGCPFDHQLVRIVKTIDLRTNQTLETTEEILWEGDDLDLFRREAPRIDERFKVFKAEPVIEDGVKTLVYQQVRYKSMFDSANRRPHITCLDPR